MDRQTFWGIALLSLTVLGALTVIGLVVYGLYSIFK